MDETRLTQLGQEARGFASPHDAVLERVPNPQADTLYLARFTVPEFTTLCKMTGQPDFAAIQIRYIPDELCIESKSLKFYLASFRHTRSFNEEIVNRILEDLVAVCNPRRMEVHGEFSPRGGISVTVDASFPDLLDEDP